MMPDVGQVWPTLVASGPTMAALRPKLVNAAAKLVDLGRIWPGVAQLRPNSVAQHFDELRRFQPEVDQLWLKFGRLWPKFDWSEFGPKSAESGRFRHAFGQSRSSPSQIWAASEGPRRRSSFYGMSVEVAANQYRQHRPSLPDIGQGPFARAGLDRGRPHVAICVRYSSSEGKERLFALGGEAQTKSAQWRTCLIASRPPRARFGVEPR